MVETEIAPKSCDGKCQGDNISQKELVYDLLEELRRAIDEGLCHEYLLGLVIAVQFILEKE